MTEAMGVISGVSVSHDQASVQDIEAVTVENQRAAVESLLTETGVEEAYVLQTCNRAEAYVVTNDPSDGRAALDAYVGAQREVAREMGHEESLRHLMRVAAGLESLVIGEDQIIGQVRDAYEDARGVGAVGTVLEHGITKAIHVGERARSETAINEGVVSLGSAAVELAEREHDLDGVTALIVGAGEMATLAAKAIDARTDVDRLVVVNRTIPHAEHVAGTVGVDATALGLDDLGPAVESATLVISATGKSGPIFDVEMLTDAGETVVIDLAQPRDVPEGVDRLSAVTRYDMDTLESVTAETRTQRREAAVAVEERIDEAFEELLTQYKRKRADEVISAMYEGAERRKAAELDRAFSKLDLDEDEREVVESMADAIVNQLLAPPTSGLRDAAEEDDWSTINTALQLFEPEFGDDIELPPTFVGEVGPEDVPDAVREEIPPGIREQLDD
ncbi:MAG: glutamyl-tRNA reductase [Halapricum sp.]